MGEKPIGEVIRERRLALGLSQRKLGELCGKQGKSAEMAIQHWEHGRLKPALEDLRPLADALQITLDELIP